MGVWRNEMWSVHSIQYGSALKILTHARSWMDLENMVLSKPAIEGQILYDFAHMR